MTRHWIEDRDGTVFKRCSRCGRTRSGRGETCPKCGSSLYKWSYRLDIARPGAKRKLEWKGGFTTQGDAKAAMTRRKDDIRKGAPLQSQRMTVAEWIQRWLAGGCGGVRASTFQGYENACRVHIVPHLGGHRRLDGVQRHDIRQFYESLRTGGLSEKSVRNIRVVLRKLL